MKINPFIGCCGAYILYDFGWTTATQGTIQQIDKKKIDIFIKRQIAVYKYKAFLIIILNEKQKEHLKSIMRDNKFKPVSKGSNGYHVGISTVYIRARKEE